MPSPTTGGGSIMFFVRLSVCLSVRCPLTPISRDAISLYLVDGFRWNLP